MKTQKTFQFKISNRTNSSKLEKIDKLSYQFKKLVNYYCYSYQHDKSNIYEKARQVTPLNSAYCQIARDVGQEQVDSYSDIHFDDKIPVRMDERVLSIESSNESDKFNYWVTISSVPYDQIKVPILGAESHFETLEQRDFDFQQVQLIQKDDEWYLHVTVSNEKELPDQYDHFVGIDLGINNIATVTVMDKDGNQLEHKVFDSGYYMDKIRHFDKRISECQSNKAYDRAQQFYQDKVNFIDDYLHKLSTKIINIASQYENTCLVMENLKHLKAQQFNKSKAHNQRLKKWHYRKLQDMLKYKAHDNNISYRCVHPAFTSQVCTHCQQRSLIRRSDDVTVGKCQSCESVVNNMDVLASVNLVRRLFFYMENKSGHCESGPDETAEFEGFTEANHFGLVEQLKTR
jgi:IS605 OrfB family transposase